MLLVDVVRNVAKLRKELHEDSPILIGTGNEDCGMSDCIDAHRAGQLSSRIVRSSSRLRTSAPIASITDSNSFGPTGSMARSLIATDASAAESPGMYRALSR